MYILSLIKLTAAVSESKCKFVVMPVAKADLRASALRAQRLSYKNEVQLGENVAYGVSALVCRICAHVE